MTFQPNQQAGSITRHDLQDFRRRVALDRRAVYDGELDGADILEGVCDMLTNLLLKLDGKGYVAANGYRHPGVDGTFPEEVR